MTIAPDGSLKHFVADTSSHSGWPISSYTVTPPASALSASDIDRLLVFYQNGVLNALAWYPADGSQGDVAVGLQWDPVAAAWSAATLSSELAGTLYGSSLGAVISTPLLAPIQVILLNELASFSKLRPRSGRVPFPDAAPV